MIEDGDGTDPLCGGMSHVCRLQLGCHLSLPLVPTILEPDLDLCLRQMQRGSQSGPLTAGQVAFHVKC